MIVPLRPLAPLVLAAAAAGCVPTTAGPSPTPDRAAADYVRFCAACHGLDGQSVEGMTVAPNLAGQGLLTLASDDLLRKSIVYGRPGENGRGKPGTKMSAFAEALRGPLSDAQIDGLVAYLRRWQTEPSIPYDTAWRADGDARAGAARYATDCAGCHGPDGWGESAPRLAGETLQAAATDAFLRETILRGRAPAPMPGFDYSDEEVADVVAFIRTLGREGDG